MNDRSLFKYTLAVLCLPVLFAAGCEERYRYPCQNPANWDKDFCKLPICDINRTCPEHIFKGQRDPRLGPPKDDQTQTIIKPPTPAPACVAPTQGANCGK